MLERLQKIIARAGIASRRHAEELILSGQVRVNGVVVTELGAKADPQHDRVEAAGRLAEPPAEPSYYILNKPVHVVSTMSDPEGRATLRHVLRGLAGGIFPVGRLDYAASGLMLLTSDGELADRIFKSSSAMPQTYWLKVAGRLSEDEMHQVRREAHARMRRLHAPGAAGPQPENPWYEVQLSGARRDLLRRTLFALGHPVEKMRRVKFGLLELGNLAEGHYRRLEPREVAQLRRLVEAPVEKSFRKPTLRGFSKRASDARAGRESPVSGLRSSPPDSVNRRRGTSTPGTRTFSNRGASPPQRTQNRHASGTRATRPGGAFRGRRKSKGPERPAR